MELRRIERDLYHPTNEKLPNIIQRGAPEHVNSELHTNLEHLRNTCCASQKLAKESGRFWVSLSIKNCVFNRTIDMGFMKINSKTVLHVVDRDMKFNAVIFLNVKTSEKV